MLDQEITPSANRTRAVRIFVPPILILISVLCGTAASLASMGSTDVNSHYFADLLPFKLLCILIPVSLISCLLPIFLLRKESVTEIGISRFFFTIPVGFAAIFVSVHSLLNGLGVSWDTLFVLLSLLTAIFYIVKPFNGFKSAKIFLSFASFALGIAIIALLYFDLKIELNSHYKLTVQFGAVGLMLGTLADARSIMSRISLGICTALKSLSLTLTLTCACSVIALFARGNTTLPKYYLVLAVFYGFYSLMTASELILVTVKASQER